MIFFSRTDDGEIDPWSWHGGENIRAPHVTDAQHTTDTHAAPAVTEKHIMTLFKEVHYKGDMLRWPYGCGGHELRELSRATDCAAAATPRVPCLPRR